VIHQCKSDSIGRYQPIFEKIIRKLQDGSLLSTEDYLMTTYFCVCHLYVGNPQGRIGALCEMRVRDLKRMKEDGIVGSPHLKTRDTYGVQFISACQPTIE
jgi:hypothetical protein